MTFYDPPEPTKASIGLDFKPFYPRLINRYISLLRQAPVSNDPDTGNSHLIWMLETIRDDRSQSITKKHRWLGYVQAAIIHEHKLTTVQQERDATRAIFNGA